jgi:hypothetical protein
MKLNPLIIQQQIANLLLLYPQLADDDEWRVDAIEGETDAFEYLSRLVRRIADRQAMANGITEYAKDIAERKARIERNVEALRTLAFKIMNIADLKKVELPEATLSIRNGASRVLIQDESALPPDCVKTITSPDKTAIKEKLVAGQAVPGAYLSNSEPSLSIRTR